MPVADGLRTYTHGMLRVTAPRRRASACALLATLVLTSCGQQDDGGSADEPSGSSTSAAPSGEAAPAGTPDCTEVWQEGARIPRSYQGCTEEGGVYVERDVLGCSSGQRMVRYADRFWGVLGGTVNEASGSLDEDRDYETSMRNCSA